MNMIAEQILSSVSAPAGRLMDIFFSNEQPFASVTFDTLPDNPPNRFTTSDLVAASLLDVRFEPRAVRRILDSEAADFSAQLKAVGDDVDLWEADFQQIERLALLAETLMDLPGVGPTRSSKLLARKRPRLAPIVDSVVRRGLGLGPARYPLRELQEAFGAKGVVKQIERIRPDAAPPSIVSTLRLADAAVWMRFSQSRNAKRARETVGL